MPHQEVFFDERSGARHVRVLKSYDVAFAREAFDSMDSAALKFLSLRVGCGDLPAPDSPHFADTIWLEVEEGAREDWNTFSYFVVTDNGPNGMKAVFVSSDWPSAEAFAKTLLQAAVADNRVSRI